MIYIQRKGGGYLETVDEFETRKEAVRMLREYRLSDLTAEFYLSSRACKGWSDPPPAKAERVAYGLPPF